MSVVRLVEYRNHDTRTALEDLLERDHSGRMRGVAFMFKTSSHQHRLGMTGVYWQHPHEVIMCAGRLMYIVNELISERGPGEPETTTMPL